jgi:spore coat polysaccharide biosynthesis predicted glycosyltransferase SpsG
MGHLLRCIALAQEASSRGWRAVIGGEISDEAAARGRAIDPKLDIATFPLGESHGWVNRVHRGGSPDVVHIDSYADVPRALLDGGAVISNIQDGRFGIRHADLAIDPNLGAERRFERPDLSTYRLIGADAAVVRAQVRDRRTAVPKVRDRFRVLVVIGGTDPEQLTGTVVRGLNGIAEPLDVVVVANGPQKGDIERLALGGQHRVIVVPFLSDLPGVAAEQDLVISAAGTSVWDFACMGVPMALVCAVENQRSGYRAAVESRIAIGLGEPPHTDLARNVAGISPAALRAQRGAQSDHLRSVVDGMGAWRIVSAWEQISAPNRPPRAGLDVEVRRAGPRDAEVLFDWRNDRVTRASSRTTGVLNWADHVLWFNHAITSEDLQLYVVEVGDEKIGTVRWDHRGGTDWEVSMTIAPASRGKGWGRAVLAAGERAFVATRPARLTAAINASNVASLRLFSGAGYLPLLPAGSDGFEKRVKWLLKRHT